MEVSSMGICSRESAPLLTSMVRWEHPGSSPTSVGSMNSRTLVGGSSFQGQFWLSRQWQAAGPAMWRGICRDHAPLRGNQSDDCSAANPWGVLNWTALDQPIPQQPGSRYMPHALSIAPAARPSLETNNHQRWRLDDEILELKELQKRLQAASTFAEKLDVIDSNRRVRKLFGGYGHSGIYINPTIALAVRTLGMTDIYLLKCMVAIGQEHVLETSPEFWPALTDANDSWEKEGKLNLEYPLSSPPQNPVKEVFSMLGQLIESWDPSLRISDHYLATLFNSPRKEPSRKDQDTNEMHGSAGLAESFIESLKSLVHMLERLEKFYDSIGGIIGYQVAALELIKASEKEQQQGKSYWSTHGARDSVTAGSSKKRFSVPLGADLSRDKAFGTQAASWGLEGLPDMAEIYPLGGAGDRLGLVDKLTGECLPVAMLPYCGRTLLEGLIRDLQAREFLYYKVYGTQHITPVAIMTSAAKKNNERVRALCTNHDWFGRGQNNFHLFEQPLVPTVAAADGCWLLSEPLTVVLKPGGHGVIWKLASDDGVFEWFSSLGRKAAIVRQISNPIAGTDVTLLALSGIGLHYNKKFGFASCERNVGAAEGVNVLVEKSTGDDSWEYGVTCIEYTEFSKLGIADVPVAPGSMQAQYPANTNVLYVDLASVERIASSQTVASLPGMIMNLKKPIVYRDHLGLKHSVHAGRIECTMQNIADSLLNRQPSKLSSKNQGNLDTFVIYNERRKVTSSAKRCRKPTDHSLHQVIAACNCISADRRKIQNLMQDIIGPIVANLEVDLGMLVLSTCRSLQTPDGSFLDVTRNAFELLTSCGVKMPQMESNHCYVDSGPPFLVLLHPALGPLWDITRQKIKGGSIAEGSEMQLEVAEFSWRDVELDGSMLVHATNVMGSPQRSEDGLESILQYGAGCGRCRLQGVRVKNKGIDWNCTTNVYWQHRVQRLETLQIILEGNAEFEAYNVTLEGSHTFEVPNGHCMRVTETPSGLLRTLEPLLPNVSIQGRLDSTAGRATIRAGARNMWMDALPTFAFELLGTSVIEPVGKGHAGSWQPPAFSFFSPELHSTPAVLKE